MQRGAEFVLRGVALALIAFVVWRLAAPEGAGARVIEGAKLEGELPSLVARPGGAVHVVFEATPRPAARDQLRAIARAGTRVTWSGARIEAMAVTAERLREPGAPVRVVATARVEVRDENGAVDGAPAKGDEAKGDGVSGERRAAGGATVVLDAPSGAIQARLGRTSALASPPARVALKPVLVLGRASWESKFAIAALEEAGWAVEARVGVAPTSQVTQGALRALDTARYSALVVLDTSDSPRADEVARFVRSGGGVLLMADAAASSRYRAMAPATVGARVAPVARDLDAPDPLAALPVYPLEARRADAVVVATRGARVVAAARREGGGRVMQVAYDETWRWRMQGGDAAVAAHRAWWSRMVASVAPAPIAPRGESGANEGAPLAQLVDALGTATAAPAAGGGAAGVRGWMLVAILVMLLGEWWLRRVRGAR